MQNAFILYNVHVCINLQLTWFDIINIYFCISMYNIHFILKTWDHIHGYVNLVIMFLFCVLEGNTIWRSVYSWYGGQFTHDIEVSLIQYMCMYYVFFSSYLHYPRTDHYDINERIWLGHKRTFLHFSLLRGKGDKRIYWVLKVHGNTHFVLYHLF